MKELYSIGDTAKLMGVSVQTLRNYSNMDLIQPQYIDENTGYRYYSFVQFHLIDRIRYLRNLGLSLGEISDILKEGKVENICTALEKQRERVRKELNALLEQADDIRWYESYFKYYSDNELENIPYIKEYPKRYLACVDWVEDSDTIESVETRLVKLRNSEAMKDVLLYRQFGYVASFDTFMENRFQEEKYFIHLKREPEKWQDFYMEIPAGKFLCMKARIRTDEWDVSLIKKVFGDSKRPPYILADEYEDNLEEYHNCPYEVQIPLLL